MANTECFGHDPGLDALPVIPKSLTFSVLYRKLVLDVLVLQSFAVDVGIN